MVCLILNKFNAISITAVLYLYIIQLFDQDLENHQYELLISYWKEKKKTTKTLIQYYGQRILEFSHINHQFFLIKCFSIIKIGTLNSDYVPLIQYCINLIPYFMMMFLPIRKMQNKIEFQISRCHFIWLMVNHPHVWRLKNTNDIFKKISLIKLHHTYPIVEIKSISFNSVNI